MAKKALFPHIGGKNKRIGEDILAFFPNKIPNIYIEPYGGSFGVAVKADYYTEDVLVIHNDLDMIIHSILKVVTQFPEETLEAVYDLLAIFEYEQSTVDYFRFLCIYKEFTNINLWEDDIFLGAAAWILKLMTQNGDCKRISYSSTGNEITKLKRKFRNKRNTIYDLEGAVAISKDAMEILKEIRNAGRSHDLEIMLYIDAPYSHSGKRKTSQDLYRKDIDKADKDIVQLAEMLEEINQSTDCKILVSEYDSPIYNAILTEEKGWNKREVCEVYKSMYYVKGGEGRPIETEYVWFNYND